MTSATPSPPPPGPPKAPLNPTARAQLLRRLAIVAGVWLALWSAYVVDCRASGGRQHDCWAANPLTPQLPAVEAFLAMPSVREIIAVLGGAGLVGGAWFQGYRTFNPNLSDPRQRDTLPPSPPSA